MRNKILEGFAKNPVIAGVTAFLLMAILSIFITSQRYQLFKQARERELFNAASQVKANLEACLRQANTATSTLSYIIRKYGIQDDFDEVAEKILDDNKVVDAIQLVRNGTITNVYPLKGNEAVMGYNIMVDSNRNKEVMTAIERKDIFFAGPFELRQGGMGIVGRQPIFINDSLWGIAAVIIRMSTLMDQIRHDSKLNRDFVFQLSKNDPNTGKEIFFVKGPEPLAESYPVSTKIPEANWTLYTKFSAASPILTRPPILILGIICALLVGLITYYLFHRPAELRKQVLEKTTQLQQNQEMILLEKMLSDTIIKGLPGIFYVAHVDGRLIRWNKNLEIHSGYSGTELEKMLTTDFLEKGQLDLIRDKKKEAFRNGRASERLNLVNRLKERFIYYVTIMPIRYNNENCILGIGIDITEQTEKEKRFSMAVTEAQETERMQICMEIHDNVKQIMAACLLNLDFVKMHLANKELASQGVVRIKRYLSESIDELRRISHQLAPSADSIDLEEKIEGLILTMNVANKLRFQYRFDSPNKDIAQQIQLSLYRILQEHISNILKHADASMVNIDLKRENGDLYMSVRDNGKGFDPSLVKSGIGLENIRRRASVLNGQISIISSPGSGCDLIVKIPVGLN